MSISFEHIRKMGNKYRRINYRHPSTSAFLFLSSGTHEALIPNTGSWDTTQLRDISIPHIHCHETIWDNRGSSSSLPLSKNLYSFGSNSMLSRTPIVGRSIPISFAKLVLAPVIRSRRSPPFSYRLELRARSPFLKQKPLAL